MKPKLRLITCILIFLLFISIVNSADIYSESKELENDVKNLAKKFVKEGKRDEAKKLIKAAFKLNDNDAETKLKEILGETEVRGEGGKGTTDTDGEIKDRTGKVTGGTGETTTDGADTHAIDDAINTAKTQIDEVQLALPGLRKLKDIDKTDKIGENYQKLASAETALSDASLTATPTQLNTISWLQTRINTLRTALEKLQTEQNKDITGGGGFGGGGKGTIVVVVIVVIILFFGGLSLKAWIAKKTYRTAKEALRRATQKGGETKEDGDIDRVRKDSENEREKSGGSNS